MSPIGGHERDERGPSQSPLFAPLPLTNQPRSHRISLRSKGGSSPCSPAKLADCAWLRFPGCAAFDLRFARWPA